MSIAASVTPLWQVLPDGTLEVNLHPGQTRAFLSDKRITVVMAGVQSGKTSGGPIWLYDRIQRFGPGDYLAVAPTHPLMSMKMLPEFLRFFKDTLHLGEWQASRRVFEFSREGFQRVFNHIPTANDQPTRIMFGSATNPDSIESATAKAAWADEAGQDDFTLKAWDALLGRLSLAAKPLVTDYQTRRPVNPLPINHPAVLPPLPGGPVLITTTPYNLGWMKQELVDKAKHGTRDDVLVVNFSSLMNPEFPREEYYARKKSMQAWRFRMRYDGVFMRPAGLIYSAFRDAPWDVLAEGADDNAEHTHNPTYTDPIPTHSASYSQYGHRVPYFPIPDRWRRFGGIDFGAVNTCILFIAEIPPHPDYSGDTSITRTPLFPTYNTHSQHSHANSPHHAPSIYSLHPTDPPWLPKYVVYRCELLGSDSSKGADMETAQFVRRAHKIASQEGISPASILWCGGAPGERQWRADYGAAGMPIAEPPVADVEAGIDYVSGGFTNGQLFVMDEPSHSDPNALQHNIHTNGMYGFIEELNTYSRKLDDMMEPTEEIKDKKKFHRMDACRYGMLLTGVTPSSSLYSQEQIEESFEHLQRGMPAPRLGPTRYRDCLEQSAPQSRGVPWSDLMW